MVDKTTRVANFHRQTLKALRALVQAAGLQHPNEITAVHIVRRSHDQAVRLLATLLLTVAPGALLAAERGEAPWPHAVFSHYWPLSRSDSFRPTHSDRFQRARSGRFEPARNDRSEPATPDGTQAPTASAHGRPLGAAQAQAEAVAA